MGPTPERLAKGDLVATTGGVVIAESALDRINQAFRGKKKIDDTYGPVDLGVVPVRGQGQLILKRLHHRMTLDFDPDMNDRMYQAGKKYEQQAHLAGLSGIAAQNILSSGGEGDPANMIPTSEASARARIQVRKAWSIMGAKLGTAVHGMLVEGRDAESVGRETSSYVSTKECRTAGTTTLRIGLWMLVNANWA